MGYDVVQYEKEKGITITEEEVEAARERIAKGTDSSHGVEQSANPQACKWDAKTLAANDDNDLNNPMIEKAKREALKK